MGYSINNFKIVLFFSTDIIFPVNNGFNEKLEECCNGVKLTNFPKKKI
jgi:hypothetical protein